MMLVRAVLGMQYFGLSGDVHVMGIRILASSVSMGVGGLAHFIHSSHTHIPPLSVGIGRCLRLWGHKI